MEARRVLEQLAEPINAHISGHEVIEVNNKSVSWYTIETTWRRGEHTKKKQRFKFIQEALLRVRDAKERLKLGVQLPMLPLSIIRGTSEIIRSRGIAGRSETGMAGPSGSSSEAADMHGAHAIQSLSHLGHSDMDSANWPSAEPSAVSTADMGSVANRRRAGYGRDPDATHATAAPGGAGPSSRRGGPGEDSAHARAHASSGDQHLPRQNAHSFGFDVPQLGRQMPYCSGETTIVGSAPKLAAIRGVVERCQVAVDGLAAELETRDATIRQQADRIVFLEEELQRLQATERPPAT